MANLETLEITINASATSASTGINDLSTSLGNLATAIQAPLNLLRQLNSQLQILRGFGGMNMPNVGNMTGGNNATARYRQAGTPISQQQALQLLNRTTSTTQLLTQRVHGMANAFVNNAVAGNLNNQQLAQGALQIRNLTNQIPTTGQALTRGFSRMSEGATQFFGKIKRIATSMLIRSAIRALIKDIKEGYNNFQEWAKTNNSEFTAAIDSMKAKSSELKNSMGAAIAPMIQAAIPVFISLANAAITAFNAVNQLLALLSGKGSWTKATQGASDFTEAAKGAGGAAQQWLAKFDELNVMNQSGGGGGGGSSDIDYSDMFEEVFTFDAKIRELAEFLQSNAESIKDMAIATGVAILGWKLSNAFAETLPMLSRIAGLIGVGAVIAITLQADWMLTNQYLNTGDEGWLIASILTTAVGGTIAAAMASRIFGGHAAAYTIALTLTLTAVTDIVALIGNTDVNALSTEGILTALKAGLSLGGAAGVLLYSVGGLALGQTLLAAGAVALATMGVVVGIKVLTSKSNISWGDKRLTEQQVDDFVTQQMFSVNVKAALNIIPDSVNMSMMARATIAVKLANLLGTFNLIKLGIAKDQDFTTAKAQVEELVTEISGYIETARKQGKLVLQYTPTLVGENDLSQGTWFTEYDQGWGTIEAFVKEKGELIGKWLTEQESKAIKDAVPDVVQAAMDQIAAVSEAIAQSKVGAEAYAGLTLSLGDLSQKSFSEVTASFKKYKEDLSKAYNDLVTEQYKNQAALVESLKVTLGADYENSQEYQDALKKLNEMGANMAQAVKDGVESASEPGTSMIREWLLEQIKVDKNFTNADYWLGQLKGEGFTAAMFGTAIRGILRNNGKKEAIELMEIIGFSGWDLLNKELKEQVLKSLKIDKKTIVELAKAQVNIGDLIDVYGFDKLKKTEQGNLINTLVEAYGSSTVISEIKKRNPKIDVTGVINMVNFGGLENNTRLQFIDSLGKAFGSDAVKAACEKAGINIGKYVALGMKSDDPTIRAIADEWNKIINGEVEKPTPKVTPELNKTSLTNIKNAIVNGIKPVVQVAAEVKQTILDKIKSAIEGVRATIQANVNVSTSSSSSSSSSSKSSSGAVSTITSFATNLQNAVKNLIGGKASGGFVNSGDLFIANENGNAEMIGRFGNQTAVANQEQIITGIQRGVSDANREQNALLMEQNNLLRGILNKTSTVQIGASAALGRVAKQSISMYNGIAGG